LNQYSDSTGSGLWNPKTRGPCCTGQGHVVEESDPPSVKTELLGGRTRKCCWQVQDEDAGERLKYFGSEYAFRNQDTNAVPVTSKDICTVGCMGCASISKNKTHCLRKLTIGKKTHKG